MTASTRQSLRTLWRAIDSPSAPKAIFDHLRNLAIATSICLYALWAGTAGQDDRHLLLLARIISGLAYFLGVALLALNAYDAMRGFNKLNIHPVIRLLMSLSYLSIVFGLLLTASLREYRGVLGI